MVIQKYLKNQVTMSKEEEKEKMITSKRDFPIKREIQKVEIVQKITGVHGQRRKSILNFT